MTVSRFGSHMQRGGKRFDGDKIEALHQHLPAEQRFIRAEHHRVLLRIFRKDIHRPAKCNAQALALAHCIVDHPLVCAERISIRINKSPLRESKPCILPDKRGVISIWNKTDILAIRFVGIDKTIPGCNRAHFLLAQSP